MSEKSSFRAELARRAATRAESRSASVSKGRLRLSAHGALHKPVDIVRALTRHGASLVKAHAALDTIAEGRSATVETSGDALEALILDLAALNLQAQIVQLPDITVRDVRARLGLSQSDFALRFGFETSTVQNWEQGRNRLDASTRLLLAIIERNPAVVDAVLVTAGETRSRASLEGETSGSSAINRDPH